MKANYNNEIENNLLHLMESSYKNNSLIGEQQILSLLQQGALSCNKLYVQNVGYREFYSNGDSFGICSSKEWNQRKQLPGFNELISDFYTNELLTLKRRGYTSSIRVQGSCHNTMLKSISECGLGNVLVIYNFKQDKIQGYYFLVHGSDHNAVNAFHNDKDVFKHLVIGIEDKINKVAKDFSLIDNATKLLPEYALQELFLGKNIKKYYQLPSGLVLNFTEKQEIILHLLAKGCVRIKEIAKEMQLELKTVEWHINRLKHKTNTNKKKELVLLAKSLSN